jgi:hypothetical protein
VGRPDGGRGTRVAGGRRECAERGQGDAGAAADVRAASSTRRGEPIAGATVTFAGCLPHLGTTAGPLDLLQVVQADARGRAHARLQAGLCYVAWAVGPADAAGSGAAIGGARLLRRRRPARTGLRGRIAVAPRVVAGDRDRGLARKSGPLRYFGVTAMSRHARPKSPLRPTGR